MITRQADYAIRCILYMSGDAQALASVKDIAVSMEIPQSFLAKILQKLLASGIVTSVRGASGGFRLSRPPAEITLYDVVTVIDGTLALNKCVVDPDSCELNSECVMHPIWVDVSQELDAILKTKDFAALAVKSIKKQSKK